MKSVQQFILEFSVVPVVVATLVGLWRYRRLGPAPRYLVPLLVACLLMEIASRTLGYFHRPNLFLAPIDTAIEFTFLALMYRRALRPSALSRCIPLLLIGFLLGSAFTYSPRLDTLQFSPVQHFIESVLVLVFVGVYFQREATRQTINRRLEREPMLWVSAALLLYFLSNIFIFLSSNYVLNLSRELSIQVWAIHGLLYIFTNVLYTVALCVNPVVPSPASPLAPAGGVT
ncbi:hypothetical protein JAO73_08040 [Hymenobacter sp. BT523]|uniref:hypothetical protein n=1 Tax=Hymenobacter sp. BT523 TaxID=2795725 RepID=UPI0018EA53EF|nr:hypothetical protein [Hymenobacter sp. BT523]MBJ6108955.1 hypothetical protein [Hymenobacter sp. BT523]